MIPQQIIDETIQYKSDCIGHVNSAEWMAGAADYFKEVAIRDSQRSIDDLAKDKWSYLEYRANMSHKDAFGTVFYDDKPARVKYLAILEHQTYIKRLQEGYRAHGIVLLKGNKNNERL